MEVEKYVVLGITTEVALANRTCAALEKANIPVLIEHNGSSSESPRRLHYKILVPFKFSQAARRISNNALLSFENRPGSLGMFSPGTSADLQ